LDAFNRLFTIDVNVDNVDNDNHVTMWSQLTKVSLQYLKKDKDYFYG